jgi:AP-3 complex subunit beta
VKKAFYSDEEDESGEEEAEVMVTVPHPEVGSLFTGGDADNDGDFSPDHRLALKSSLPLLKSRNAAVVLAVCSLHFYCGTQSMITAQQIGKPRILFTLQAFLISVSPYLRISVSPYLRPLFTGKALVRILRNRRETQFVVLSSINAMVRERPSMFRPFLSDFFVKASDPLFTRSV